MTVEPERAASPGMPLPGRQRSVTAASCFGCGERLETREVLGEAYCYGCGGLFCPECEELGFAGLQEISGKHTPAEHLARIQEGEDRRATR